jgi:2-polyprenyl-6-methoxyphenol hydroxylase-like FAD-dependent oxidoreductase
VRVAIAGGGPAGMMLGLLLARAGVEVSVHEKHGDFLRDFRGDTLHPSTLEVMRELGLLERLLALPHQKVPRVSARVGKREVTIADLSRLPVHCPYIALMPQWDFLDFLAREAKRYEGFSLAMESEVTGIVQHEGRVVGLRIGEREEKADLVIAADGRHSTVRKAAALPAEDFGAPMDVLWFRLSRRAGDPEQIMGIFAAGRIIVLLNRGDYWQCAFVIAKDAIDEVHRRGLPAFREGIVKVLPWLADRVPELADWDQAKLLTVRVDRLVRWWSPGVLCIGDAAHAMSPVGGVGINLAIQDAVAAANILAEPISRGTLSMEHLAAVQRRRDWPTRATQRLQLGIQNQVVARALAGEEDFTPPFVRLLGLFPSLSRIPARLIGMGFRPEHVRTSAAVPARARPGTTG